MLSWTENRFHMHNTAALMTESADGRFFSFNIRRLFWWVFEERKWSLFSWPTCSQWAEFLRPQYTVWQCNCAISESGVTTRTRCMSVLPWLSTNTTSDGVLWLLVASWTQIHARSWSNMQQNTHAVQKRKPEAVLSVGPVSLLATRPLVDRGVDIGRRFFLSILSTRDPDLSLAHSSCRTFLLRPYIFYPWQTMSTS